MQRNRTTPFWTSPSLKPLRTDQEVQPQGHSDEAVEHTDDEEGGIDLDAEGDALGEGEGLGQSEDDEDGDQLTRTAQFTKAKDILTGMLRLVEREEQYGGDAFIDQVLQSNRRNDQLLGEARARDKAMHLPRT
ncbi:hypothetical protein CF328_g8530 [Tilletia controversa]|nr:hypothetical protein CF328_g8530 [Tilletia controversa]